MLAAEWGHGRRKGWLSNLHLGARDPADGEFVMLGKTFKGLTDELLAWQTERFLAARDEPRRHTVYVRPELVVEIAFDGVQTQSALPGRHGAAVRPGDSATATTSPPTKRTPSTRSGCCTTRVRDYHGVGPPAPRADRTDVGYSQTALGPSPADSQATPFHWVLKTGRR